VNDQVAGNRQFTVAGACHARGFEGERRKLFHIEEVGALQMPVALGVAGIDRSRIDRGFDIRQ